MCGDVLVPTARRSIRMTLMLWTHGRDIPGDGLPTPQPRPPPTRSRLWLGETHLCQLPVVPCGSRARSLHGYNVTFLWPAMTFTGMWPLGRKIKVALSLLRRQAQGRFHLPDPLYWAHRELAEALSRFTTPRTGFFSGVISPGMLASSAPPDIRRVLFLQAARCLLGCDEAAFLAMAV